jgi:hypothetical protein
MSLASEHGEVWSAQKMMMGTTCLRSAALYSYPKLRLNSLMFWPPAVWLAKHFKSTSSPTYVCVWSCTAKNFQHHTLLSYTYSQTWNLQSVGTTCGCCGPKGIPNRCMRARSPALKLCSYLTCSQKFSPSFESSKIVTAAYDGSCLVLSKNLEGGRCMA